MRTQRSFQFALVTAALAVVTATASLPVLSAEEAIADECAVTGSHGGIYPQKVNRAVNPAEAMTNYLHEAEVQLNCGSVSGARSILSSSRDFSRKLRLVQAEAKRALQSINRADETGGNGVGMLPAGWIGIYSSLDEMQVYAPELAKETRELLKQAQKQAMSGYNQRTAGTLEKIATGVPSGLQPGQSIDRQVLLALELLGEHQPDIARAKRVVEDALNRLIVVDRTATAQETYRAHDRV